MKNTQKDNFNVYEYDFGVLHVEGLIHGDHIINGERFYSDRYVHDGIMGYTLLIAYEPMSRITRAINVD